MTKFIAKVNGFRITQRLVGDKDTYFVAERGGVIEFRGKRLSYVEKKAKSHSCLIKAKDVANVDVRTPQWFKVNE